MDGRTVGFDLDMTLLDTSTGIAETLRRLGSEEGVEIDTEDVLARLGTPWREVMLAWFPEERSDHVTVRFRELFVEHGLDGCVAMAGAAEALELVRGAGFRPIVVTGRHGPTARACLAQVGFDLGDDVTGGVFGPAKGEVLRAAGAVAYVGDTPSDVEGARAADALAVSVATGPATVDELRAAGADVVLEHLEHFGSWWREWRTRTAVPSSD